MAPPFAPTGWHCCLMYAPQPGPQRFRPTPLDPELRVHPQRSNAVDAAANRPKTQHRPSGIGGHWTAGLSPQSVTRA
jgi:hypothetical protein